MEPHCALAAWDEEGGLTVWASTQNPYSVRVELAEDVPRAARAASASSCRSSAAASAARPTRRSSRIASALARVAGRPVRLAISAEDAFRTVRRCDARVRVRARLPARRHALGRRVPRRLRRRRLRRHRAAHHPEGHLYRHRPVPRRRTSCCASRAVYTNTTPGGAFRGFGVPQLAWALRVAARRRGPAPRSRSGRAAPAEPPRPRRGVRARRDADRRQVRGEPERAPPRRSAGRRRPRPIAGAGVAMMMKASIGAHGVGGDRAPARRRQRRPCWRARSRWGRARAPSSPRSPRRCWPSRSTRVGVATPDTAITPYDQTTSSSRSTTMMGRAVEDAAEDVRDQLLRIAAGLLGVAARRARRSRTAPSVGGRRAPAVSGAARARASA